MSIVAEYDWKTNTMTHHDTRSAFRQAVAAVAAKSRAKLPACAGHIDSAVKLVLAGDVELLPQGGARVASRSDASVQYHTVNGHCDCKAFARAPEGLCRHRLAYGIARRASELVPMSPPALPEPSVEPQVLAAPAPTRERAGMRLEAQVVIEGRPVKVAVWGPDDADVQARLQAVLGQYQAPQALAAQADATPQCSTHGAMKPSTKGQGWYCPHKLADDSWCPSKGK